MQRLWLYEEATENRLTRRSLAQQHSLRSTNLIRPAVHQVYILTIIGACVLSKVGIWAVRDNNNLENLCSTNPVKLYCTKRRTIIHNLTENEKETKKKITPAVNVYIQRHPAQSVYLDTPDTSRLTRDLKTTTSVGLPHNENSTVFTSRWNMTSFFFCSAEIVDARSTSGRKVCRYYLVMKHDLFVCLYSGPPPPPAQIKDTTVESLELKGSPFKAWSGSV